MFLLIPYRVDVPLYRYPIANWVIIAAIIACFGVQEATGHVSDLEGVPFVLNGWQPLGLVGHIFLHGGIMHLVGNLLFLWVFGNAICERLGNIAYPLVFLALGVLAGAAHNLIMVDVPVIGASGAINGVVGMFLIWFPINEISCFYLVWFIIKVWYGFFDLSSYWIILLWLIFDALGAVLGGGDVAYWAHLGGFGAGMVLAALLTLSGVIEVGEGERTLLDVLHLRRSSAPPEEAKPWRTKGRVAAYGLLPETKAPPPPPQPIPLADHEPLVLPSEAVKKAAVAPPGEEKMILFTCRCGRALKAPPEKAGQRAQCPTCKEIVQVPMS